jgi:hypothetical protein
MLHNTQLKEGAFYAVLACARYSHKSFQFLVGGGVDACILCWSFAQPKTRVKCFAPLPKKEIVCLESDLVNDDVKMNSKNM